MTFAGEDFCDQYSDIIQIEEFAKFLHPRHEWWLFVDAYSRWLKKLINSRGNSQFDYLTAPSDVKQLLEQIEWIKQNKIPFAIINLHTFSGHSEETALYEFYDNGQFDYDKSEEKFYVLLAELANSNLNWNNRFARVLAYDTDNNTELCQYAIENDLLEPKVAEELLKSIKSKFVCQMGYKSCTARGFCNGDC